MDPGVRDEYLYDEITNEELLFPTVEYKLVNEDLEKEKEKGNGISLIFIYHFCLIDISEISLKLNFGKYVNNI